MEYPELDFFLDDYGNVVVIESNSKDFLLYEREELEERDFIDSYFF